MISATSVVVNIYSKTRSKGNLPEELTAVSWVKRYSGEKFSLTPLWVRPGGVHRNNKIVLINPPGRTKAVLRNPPFVVDSPPRIFDYIAYICDVFIHCQ